MDFTTLRIYLLDEHPIVRRGLSALINATCDLEVVGESGSVDDAPELVVATAPDVVVVELEIGSGRGIEVCRTIKQLDPSIDVVLFAARDGEDLAGAILAGASGFVRKSIEPAAFVNALRVVGSGHQLFDSALAADVLRGRVRKQPTLGAPLTPVERRILDLISEGRTNKQIAETLHLSPHTVKNRVTSILAKLGVQGRTQAALVGTRMRSEAYVLSPDA